MNYEMDYESLQAKLKEHIIAFKNKWCPIYDKYNGDIEKFWGEHCYEIFEDIHPIGGTAWLMEQIRDFDSLAEIDKIADENI